MRFFNCRHRWEEVPNSRKYTASSTVGNVKNVSEYTLRAILSGFTTIEEKCINCGKLNITEVLGDVR